MSELVSDIPATILVIDDYPANLVTFNTLLPLHFPHGRIVNASSGEEGLRMVHTEPPDIILLDVSMPGLDGYEVCRQIKKDPGTSHIPILMISAVFTENEDRANGFSSGADGYICKPYDRGALIAQIMALLNTKRQRDQVRAQKAEAEKQLEVSNREIEFAEQLLGQLVNSLPVVLWALDLEGRVIMLAGQGVYKDKTLKFTRKGYSVLKAYEDAIPDMQEKFNDAVKGHTNQSIEEIGGNIWQVIYIPLKNADDDTVGVVGMAVDISEQHRCSTALLKKCEHLQEAVGQNLVEDLGQQLTGLSYLVKALESELDPKSASAKEESAHIRQVLDTAIHHTRKLAQGLYPEKINYRLSSAIEAFAHSIRSENNVVIDIDFQEELDQLAPELHGQIYNIVQEAVYNAVNHGNATHINIRLCRENEDLHLDITNNGAPLKPDYTQSNGVGLLLVSYRIQKLGGRVALRGLPDSRVSLNAVIPAVGLNVSA